MVIINFGVKTIVISQKKCHLDLEELLQSSYQGSEMILKCKDENYVGFAGSNLYKQSNKVYVVMKKFL